MLRLGLWILSCVVGLFQTLSAYELALVTMFRNEAPHFKEWIEYHRMVGVDHFYLYNDTSKDNWQEVLDPYIKEGLVEVIDWSNRHIGPDFVGAQVDAFRDGIRRSQGNAKWVTLIDLDEFLLPMKERTVQECIAKHFPNANAIYVNWRNFGTSGVSIPTGKPILFQLTSCSLPSHSDNCIGKSIIRPECVRIKDIWYPHHFPLVPNTQYVNGDNKPIRFEGSILVTDGLHHGNVIRINHYVLGDETRYQKKRLSNVEGPEKVTLLEHYKSFSLMKDFSIINLIRKNPSVYEKVWKP